MTNERVVDSGVSWIGSIPASWRVIPFRYVFTESSEVNGQEPVGQMLSVSGYRGVEPKVYDDENRRRTDAELETYRVVRPGQLAVNTMWLNYAGLGVSEHLGHVSPAYRAYSIDPRLDKRYAHHLLRSSVYVNAYTGALTGIRPNSLQMPRQTLQGWPVLVPPLEEQRRIAEILDRETAQIDELIAKQEQLLTTLAERRDRYLLSEVAPLAGDATGTEWFGKVPSDWRSTRLKYVSSVASGGTPSTQVEAYWSESEDGTPWVAISDMSATDAVGSTAKRLTIDGLSQYPGAPGRPGTILFAMYASVGAVSRLAVSATWNQAILGLTPRKDVDGDFLFYVLKAIRPHLVHYFRSNTQDNMNAQQVAGLPLLMPPLDEQRRISARVKSQLDDYRALSERANAVIATLRERRQALISAAVTGQIDVGGAS